MSSKKIGTIKTMSQKSIGCLYRPFPSQETLATSNIPKGSLRGSRVNLQNDSARKRANSVGMIYTTSGSERRTSTGKEERCRKEYPHLINYQQMENKLSNYLTCTIRTTNRQKYNYLSQNYVPLSGESQPFTSKLKYCENEIRSRKNILQMADDLNRNNFQCPLNNQKAAVKLEQKAQKPTSKRVQDKENLPHYGREMKKEKTQCLLNMNHHVQKEELSKKLMKIIDSYENKNKQLSLQMQKIEKKFEAVQPKGGHEHSLKLTEQKSMIRQDRNEQTEEACPNDSLNEAFKKLIQTNFKSICLSCHCDQKLDDLWRCLHNQIVLDQRLRIMRAFINQDNVNNVFEAINGKRIKKLEMSSLKKNSEEYDPFLIEKIGDIMKTTNSDFTSKNTLAWITENFIKCYDESERHWLKYLSQQKMECFIRTMIMEQQITGLRQNEAMAKDLNLRDFTRWLSILFKANLRNRNIYQIFSKLKDMSYLGRFIQILEGKAGKGSETRKFVSSK